MATIDNYKIKIDVEGQQQVDKLKSSVDGLKTAIAGITFGAFISGAMRMADAISDLSAATGVSISKIVAFREAMSLSGGDAENAGKMIATFFNTLEQAATGTEAAQKALEDVGISLNDLKTLNEEELLNKAVKNLGEMEAGAKRTAEGMKIFGKSFKEIDPTTMSKLLSEGDFSKVSDAVQKAADHVDAMHRSFTNLQLAALEALEPIVGKMDQTGLSLAQAEKIINAIAIAFGIALGAKVVSSIVEVVGVIKLLNNALKGTVIMQTALTALSGPKGWAIMAAGAAAATAAVYGLNKALEETPGAEPAAGGTTEQPKGPAFPNAQKYNDQEIEARKKAAVVAQEQTNILKIQNAEAQKYLQTVINTMDVESNAASLIRANAQLEQDAKVKIAGLEKDISAELTNRRGPNQEVISQLRQQIDEINNNVEATKKLRQAEYDRAMQLKETALLVKSQQQNMAENVALANYKYQLDAVGLIGDSLKQHQITQAANIELGSKLLQIDQERLALGNKITDVDEADFKRRAEMAEKYAKDRIDFENLIYQQEKALRDDSVAGARAAFEQLARSVDPFVVAQNQMTSIFNSMNSAIDRFVDTGKFSFSDFANSIIKDLIKIELKASATRLFTAAFGKGGSFASLLGFADGGTPPVDKPSIVGERGPELFIPRVAGTIIPNEKLGQYGGSAGTPSITHTYVTNNINAVDAKSVAQLFAENRKVLLGTVKMAEKEMPYRIR